MAPKKIKSLKHLKYTKKPCVHRMDDATCGQLSLRRSVYCEKHLKELNRLYRPGTVIVLSNCTKERRSYTDSYDEVINYISIANASAPHGVEGWDDQLNVPAVLTVVCNAGFLGDASDDGNLDSVDSLNELIVLSDVDGVVVVSMQNIEKYMKNNKSSMMIQSQK